MGIIRNQSIKSTVITYIGFGIGGVYLYLLTKLDPNLAGLTRFFLSVAAIIFAFANLGSVTMMNKFYPYYRDQLAPKNRDILGLVIISCTIGFLLCIVASILFQDLVVKKFGTKSIYVVQYYYFLIPFSLGYLVFTAFEHFSYNQYKSIPPIFLKEVALRVINMILVILFMSSILGVTGFIWGYTFTYCAIALALTWYLYRQRDLIFSFRISKVTRRLSRKMITFSGMIYASSLFSVIASNIDNLSISSIIGLGHAFVYEIAVYATTLMLIPQRSIISIAIPVLAKAWKDKNIPAIQSLYSRSSATMLTYAILIYMLIWLNMDAGWAILQLKEVFYLAQPVIIVMGAMRVIDMSFGVNSQIIGTSNYWRVELFSNIVQFCIMIPTNVIFIKSFGMMGAAYANFISITVFSFIRFGFLYYKFKLQPYTWKSFFILLAGVIAFGICYLIHIKNPWISVIVRTALFTGLFLGPVLIFGLSKDVTEAYHMVMGRLRKK
jgi:O-antigen/teichoic acid export membrane protein